MGKGKAGAPKKYKSASELAQAVNDYFNSLPIKDGVFKRPPTMPGLCIFLGITRQTFWNYAKGKNAGMAFVAESARMIMEDFWAGQLAGKWAVGAKFALECGFGWNKDGLWSNKQGERDRTEEAGGVVEIQAVRRPDREEAEDG